MHSQPIRLYQGDLKNRVKDVSTRGRKKKNQEWSRRKRRRKRRRRKTTTKQNKKQASGRDKATRHDIPKARFRRRGIIFHARFSSPAHPVVHLLSPTEEYVQFWQETRRPPCVHHSHCFLKWQRLGQVRSRGETTRYRFRYNDAYISVCVCVRVRVYFFGRNPGTLK